MGSWNKRGGGSEVWASCSTASINTKSSKQHHCNETLFGILPYISLSLFGPNNERDNSKKYPLFAGFSYKNGKFNKWEVLIKAGGWKIFRKNRRGTRIRDLRVYSTVIDNVGRLRSNVVVYAVDYQPMTLSSNSILNLRQVKVPTNSSLVFN